MVDGAQLSAKSIRLLRQGRRTHGWRSCSTKAGIGRSAGCSRRSISRVLRLIRVAIGPLQLGSLAKGQWRSLEPGEIESLR